MKFAAAYFPIDDDILPYELRRRFCVETTEKAVTNSNQVGCSGATSQRQPEL